MRHMFLIRTKDVLTAIKISSVKKVMAIEMESKPYCEIILREDSDGIIPGDTVRIFTVGNLRNVVNRIESGGEIVPIEKGEVTENLMALLKSLQRKVRKQEGEQELGMKSDAD